MPQRILGGRARRRRVGVWEGNWVGWVDGRWASAIARSCDVVSGSGRIHVMKVTWGMVFVFPDRRVRNFAQLVNGVGCFDKQRSIIYFRATKVIGTSRDSPNFGAV